MIDLVLVHGAWADGSSWAEVIPRLQAAGLKVSRDAGRRPADDDIEVVAEIGLSRNQAGTFVLSAA